MKLKFFNQKKNFFKSSLFFNSFGIKSKLDRNYSETPKYNQPTPEPLPDDVHDSPLNISDPPPNCSWLTLRSWNCVFPLLEGWSGAQSKTLISSLSQQNLPVEKEFSYMFFKMNEKYMGAPPDIICNLNCYKIDHPCFITKNLHENIVKNNNVYIRESGIEELSSSIVNSFTRSLMRNDILPSHLQMGSDIWIHSQFMANDTLKLLYELTIEGKADTPNSIQELTQSSDLIRDNFLLLDNQENIIVHPRFPKKSISK